jgi:putative FmdB family regulatory protein
LVIVAIFLREKAAPPAQAGQGRAAFSKQSGVSRMPTYEYKCTSCGHTFEAIQSMNDKPLSRCPKCKSAVRRVINGGIGIIFKGSGFYTTDNKKSSALTGGSNGKKAESSSSPDGSSKETKDSTTKASSPGDSSKEKAAAS